jgi:hypothetical protein
MTRRWACKLLSMTVGLAILDNDGCSFVIDKRICGGVGQLVTDNFDKLFEFAGGALTVALAGDVGMFQRFMLFAARGKVRSIEDLRCEQIPGEYEFLAYDAVAHALYAGDGAGVCVRMPENELLGIGSGADYCLGYLAAAGVPEGTEERLHALASAIEQCSATNLGVSPAVDGVYQGRMQPAPSTKAKRARRNSRPRASKSRKQ